MAFIKAMTMAYKCRDMSPAQALQSARIAPAMLDEPDARVTASQLEAFTAFAMRELGDEGLGWFSRRLPWGTYGLLCRATLPSVNLLVAVKRWCRHHALLVQDIDFSLTVTGSTAELTITENRPLGQCREFCLVTMFRNMHGFACWLADSRIPLRQAQFPFPEPAHAPAYALMFRAPVRFGAQRARVTFDAAYLQLPVRRNDDDLRQLLQRPLPLVVLQYRHDRLLSQRIRQMLRQQDPAHWHAPALSDALNVSVRSLHRHLADEGTSLQKIKTELRHNMACRELAQTDRQIKQIASHVGFQSEASFARAFKQWTGQSPAQYRRSQTRAHA
jgi:AraC-like DNA-binding protein